MHLQLAFLFETLKPLKPSSLRSQEMMRGGGPGILCLIAAAHPHLFLQGKTMGQLPSTTLKADMQGRWMVFQPNTMGCTSGLVGIDMG